MVILVSPDSRGRIDLSRVVQKREAQYAVEVDVNGIVTLTPAVIVRRRAFEAALPVRPALSAEEVFGETGALDLLEALAYNGVLREMGNPEMRVSSSEELHSLIWGDVA